VLPSSSSFLTQFFFFFFSSSSSYSNYVPHHCRLSSTPAAEQTPQRKRSLTSSEPTSIRPESGVGVVFDRNVPPSPSAVAVEEDPTSCADDARTPNSSDTQQQRKSGEAKKRLSGARSASLPSSSRSLEHAVAVRRKEKSGGSMIESGPASPAAVISPRSPLSSSHVHCPKAFRHLVLHAFQLVSLLPAPLPDLQPLLDSCVEASREVRHMPNLRVLFWMVVVVVVSIGFLFFFVRLFFVFRLILRLSLVRLSFACSSFACSSVFRLFVFRFSVRHRGSRSRI
jgi:hypothetical protein